MKQVILLILVLACTRTSAQEIALTFDDAPTEDGPLFSGNERTEKIISHIKHEGALQVAFFVITGNINEHSEQRLTAYAREGHLLANHTHSHQWIHRLGTKGYLHDIAKADSMLRDRTGFVNWFRYPFLDEGGTKTSRDSIRSFLSERQLINGYVTIDNYDWYLNHLLKKAIQQKKQVDYQLLKEVYLEHIYNSIKFYDQISKQVLNRSPRHVLLLHENDLNALFLGDLINMLKENGWKIISPTEAYKDPIAANVPDVLFNGQGRIAAIAKAKGLPPSQLVQEAEDEAYLDSLVARKKVFR